MEWAVSVVWLPSCASTQDELWRAPPEVTTVATTHQSAGRGRLGRVWQSESGQSLALSWRAPIAGLELSMLPLLSLATGVAIHRWVSEICSPERREDLALKWPNDLLYQQRKLAGILCEGRLITVKREPEQQVVIGIGINLLSAPDLRPKPAYLNELCDDELSLEDVRAQLDGLIHQLMVSVELLRARPAQLLEDWRGCALQVGTPLKSGLKRGLYAGINERGALLLDIDGSLCTVETGDVELMSHLPHLSGER